MSWCRCTAALGVPVVPDVYSQKATSSLVVAAGSSSPDSAVTSSLNPICPGPARPAQVAQAREARPDRFDRRRALLARDGDLGATVVQDVFVVARLEQRVRGNRHGADLQRAPERVHELGAVGQ